MSPKKQTCRACPAEIRMVRLDTGRWNPLNPEPDAERGNVILEGNEATIGRVLGTEEAVARRLAGEPLYLSHFATCPKRDKFRKADRRRSGTQGPAGGPPKAESTVPAPPSLF